MNKRMHAHTHADTHTPFMFWLATYKLSTALICSPEFIERKKSQDQDPASLNMDRNVTRPRSSDRDIHTQSVESGRASTESVPTPRPNHHLAGEDVLPSRKVIKTTSNNSDGITCRGTSRCTGNNSDRRTPSITAELH